MAVWPRLRCARQAASRRDMPAARFLAAVSGCFGDASGDDAAGDAEGANHACPIGCPVDVLFFGVEGALAAVGLRVRISARLGPLKRGADANPLGGKLPARRARRAIADIPLSRDPTKHEAPIAGDRQRTKAAALNQHGVIMGSSLLEHEDRRHVVTQADGDGAPVPNDSATMAGLHDNGTRFGDEDVLPPLPDALEEVGSEIGPHKVLRDIGNGGGDLDERGRVALGVGEHGPGVGVHIVRIKGPPTGSGAASDRRGESPAVLPANQVG